MQNRRTFIFRCPTIQQLRRCSGSISNTAEAFSQTEVCSSDALLISKKRGEAEVPQGWRTLLQATQRRTPAALALPPGFCAGVLAPQRPRCVPSAQSARLLLHGWRMARWAIALLRHGRHHHCDFFCLATQPIALPPFWCSLLIVPGSSAHFLSS